MTKIIIEFGDFGPEACIRDFGQVSLSDFYLACSKKTKQYVENLYTHRLEALHSVVEMKDEDVEMIKLFASDRSKIDAKQMDEFQNELNRKYPALSIPEQAEV